MTAVNIKLSHIITEANCKVREISGHSKVMQHIIGTSSLCNLSYQAAVWKYYMSFQEKNVLLVNEIISKMDHTARNHSENFILWKEMSVVWWTSHFCHTQESPKQKVA